MTGAWSDASGRVEDVTARLARQDRVYVDPGPETATQGVRREHALVLDLGPVAKGSRVVLFLNGWIFYTDTSINVSLSQRKDLSHFPLIGFGPDVLIRVGADQLGRDPNPGIGDEYRAFDDGVCSELARDLA